MYGFPEPFGLEYYGLDTLVLWFQTFCQNLIWQVVECFVVYQKARIMVSKPAISFHIIPKALCIQIFSSATSLEGCICNLCSYKTLIIFKNPKKTHHHCLRSMSSLRKYPFFSNNQWYSSEIVFIFTLSWSPSNSKSRKVFEIMGRLGKWKRFPAKSWISP